jgi:hypothetical protein
MSESRLHWFDEPEKHSQRSTAAEDQFDRQVDQKYGFDTAIEQKQCKCIVCQLRLQIRKDKGSRLGEVGNLPGT